MSSRLQTQSLLCAALDVCMAPVSSLGCGTEPCRTLDSEGAVTCRQVYLPSRRVSCAPAAINVLNDVGVILQGLQSFPERISFLSMFVLVRQSNFPFALTIDATILASSLPFFKASPDSQSASSFYPLPPLIAHPKAVDIQSVAIQFIHPLLSSRITASTASP